MLFPDTLQIFHTQKTEHASIASNQLKYKEYSFMLCWNYCFIWVKIGLLINIISVNKDLARHSAFWNDALAKRKSVA
jgi:hypothetical protein